MRTAVFKKVLEGAFRRIGLDPDTVPVATKKAWSNYVTERVREAWEWFDWPEMKQLEERAYRDNYDNLDPDDILVGDIVYYNNEDEDNLVEGYFRALTTGPVDLPSTTSSDWEVANDFEKYIALDQTFKQEIDIAINVWAYNPRIFSNVIAAPTLNGELIYPIGVSPALINYVLTENGITVPPGSPNTVWVEFTIPVPTFEYNVYDVATAYAQGDIVYYATTGECYKCRTANTGILPPTSVIVTPWWERMQLPYVFSRFVERAVSGDGSIEDGQLDTGNDAISKAWDALIQDKDTVTLRQDQQKYQTFSVQTR